jgi:hypothetical protein
MHLAAELARAVLVLYQEGPAMLARTHEFPANYSPHKALEELEEKMTPTLR